MSQETKPALTVPPTYREPEGFKALKETQKPISIRMSDDLLDWATSSVAEFEGADQITFTYNPRILSSDKPLRGNELDMRVAVFEPLYLVAGELMDHAATLSPKQQEQDAQFLLARGIFGLFSGITYVADQRTEWGPVIRDTFVDQDLLLINAYIGDHQLIDAIKTVEVPMLTLRYLERNPAQPVKDTLPKSTVRLAASLSVTEQDGQGRLDLELMARELKWVPGKKPGTIVHADNTPGERDYIEEIYGEKRKIEIAKGDPYVLQVAVRDFAHKTLGTDKLYYTPPEAATSFKQMQAERMRRGR